MKSTEVQESQREAQEAQRIERYFTQIPASIRSSFSEEQVQGIKGALKTALEKSKPTPKIVDLRFIVDLIFARYYFVLFVGRDRRAKRRNPNPNVINRIGNVIAVIILLIGLNLLVSSFIFLSLYLAKSALGIDLFPGHMGQTQN